MSSPRALPTWAYIPGSNRGLAAVGSKQCSRGAKRVPAGRSTADQFFAKPNMSFAPELYLETEQLGKVTAASHMGAQGGSCIFGAAWGSLQGAAYFAPHGKRAILTWATLEHARWARQGQPKHHSYNLLTRGLLGARRTHLGERATGCRGLGEKCAVCHLAADSVYRLRGPPFGLLPEALRTLHCNTLASKASLVKEPRRAPMPCQSAHQLQARPWHRTITAQGMAGWPCGSALSIKHQPVAPAFSK